MIQEIALGLIYAKQNNRQSFTGIDDLASSILEHGLIQPITVRPDGNGRYIILAGERRYRAHQHAGLETIEAIVKDDISSSQSYLITLLENDNRQETNDIEKALGYSRAIDTLGLEPADLARAIGKRIDYIDRRLALLELRPDIQKLVADGQLLISYALAMAGLDHDRQLIAMKALNDNPAPTLAWFRTIAGELLDQQTQLGLDFGLFGDGSEIAELEPVTITMPSDPADYRPSFDPSHMASSVANELERWQTAMAGWQHLGKIAKCDQCQAIIIVLEAMARALPAMASSDNPADRVWRLLLERGPMTTRSIYQFANIARAQWLTIKSNLLADGRILESSSGRGYRYTAIQ